MGVVVGALVGGVVVVAVVVGVAAAAGVEVVASLEASSFDAQALARTTEQTNSHDQRIGRVSRAGEERP